MDSWTHLHTIHTAPESVKRVKSSAQILGKSFFWRLNATNALGGSSGHQRTPLLNACQKWSPLMTRATSKCICGVQPPEIWLNHYFCSLLFTCPEQCASWHTTRANFAGFLKQICVKIVSDINQFFRTSLLRLVIDLMTRVPTLHDSWKCLTSINFSTCHYLDWPFLNHS